MYTEYKIHKMVKQAREQANRNLNDTLEKMKSHACKKGLLPKGCDEFEFDILWESGRVVGLHYWSCEDKTHDDMQHHYHEIDDDEYLNKLAAYSHSIVQILNKL